MSTTTTSTHCDTRVCTPDFPCEQCVIDWLISEGRWATESLKPIWQGVTPFALNEPAAPERGDGTGSSTTRSLGRGFRPATDKQVGYLLHLCAELGQPAPEVAGLSSAEASELIDLARAEVKRMPAAPAPTSEDGTLVGKWKKGTDGEWRILCPGAKPGDDITVRRSSGEERPARLGREVGEGLFAEDRQGPKSERRAAKRPTFDVVEGMAYWTADRKVVTVQRSRETNNLYGKVWDGEEFVFTRGALQLITEQLTAEEAAAFGLKNTRCCCCGRKLTKKSSIAAGIGPICAAKF